MSGRIEKGSLIDGVGVTEEFKSVAASIKLAVDQLLRAKTTSK